MLKIVKLLVVLFVRFGLLLCSKVTTNDVCWVRENNRLCKMFPISLIPRTSLNTSFFKSGTVKEKNTLKRSNSTIYFFASPINGGQLLEKRICSSRSKFFPSRVYPVLGGLHLGSKQKFQNFDSLLRKCKKKKKKKLKK